MTWLLWVQAVSKSTPPSQAMQQVYGKFNRHGSTWFRSNCHISLTTVSLLRILFGLPNGNPVVRLCTCQRNVKYCSKYCFPEGPLEVRMSRQSTVKLEIISTRLFFAAFIFWLGELVIIWTQWKAIRSQSCKLPSQLGKRQAQKPAKSQHVKQNKPSTCQWDKTVLFTDVAAFTLVSGRWTLYISLNSWRRDAGVRNWP